MPKKPKDADDSALELDDSTPPVGDVEIDLDAKPDAKPVAETPEQLAARITAEVEARFKPFIKQAEVLRRQNEQLTRELSTRPAPKTPDAKPAPEDLWASIDDGPRWRTEIETLAEQKAKKALEDWEQQRVTREAAARRVAVVSSSQSKVVELYPELDPQTGDETSAVAKAFAQVCNEDPTIYEEPHGPEIAMYRMEQLLRTQGIAPRSWGPPANGAPRSPTPPRGTKVLASDTGLPASRPSAGSGRVTLSAEEREFCDSNGIKYEDYAKSKRALETTGAVEA